MKIGILATQGAIQPHADKIHKFEVETVFVNSSEDLKKISGIILPGGESSAMIHILKADGLWEDLKHFLKNKPSFGFCAGAILLAKEVEHPKQDSFGIIDVAISRNAYGRQSHSFIDEVTGTGNYQGQSIEGVFIRAPKFLSWGSEVDPCFKYKEETVMVRQGKTFAATFHPELSRDDLLHQEFIRLCQQYG